MSILIKANNFTTTQEALEFYKSYKESFGEVVRAEMISDKVKVDYVFKLINSKGEEMTFDGELTSGYGGEGPRGTLKVLQMAGFNVDKEFIQNNTSFKLNK